MAPSVGDRVLKLGFAPRLTAVLDTDCGDFSAGWTIANHQKDNCRELAAIVPRGALSAGALDCLAAKPLIMSRPAHPGPFGPALLADLVQPSPKGDSPRLADIRSSDLLSAEPFAARARRRPDKKSPATATPQKVAEESGAASAGDTDTLRPNSDGPVSRRSRPPRRLLTVSPRQRVGQGCQPRAPFRISRKISRVLQDARLSRQRPAS
ncbi:MAG: hypothetical protein LBT40_03200 [Deltaproteobacteria bacterium]|nr:hypothetical protein [Deltaproteobacteria bacterium]